MFKGLCFFLPMPDVFIVFIVLYLLLVQCHVRLNTIDSYQNMKTKTESFWRGMLQSFIQNKPSVVVSPCLITTLSYRVL